MAACGGQRPEPPQIVPTPRPVVPPVNVVSALPRDPVDSLMESMSLREKVGQLIMPWMPGSYASVNGEEFAKAREWVDSLGIGGILLSTGTPLDAPARLNALQQISRVPLLVAADMEWGVAMRLQGATSFPMAMAIGATDREEDAYEMGRVTAEEARAVGIHLTFSPVADINNNPENPIINTRSFGEDPNRVAALVAAYVRGAEEHGLMATAKHFPGHGDTGTDSHIDVPVTDACWSRLDTLELVPFRAAIEAGVTAVMTAHIALPCIDGDSAPPASLSPAITTGILRDSLHFHGLVVVDALSMGALISHYGANEAAVLAFTAGVDLLIDPTDPPGLVNTLAAAVESGRITPQRLDASVRRILELKRRAGLFEHRIRDLARIPETVGSAEFQKIADDIAQRSLTLIQRGELDRFLSDSGSVAVVLYAEETNLTIGNDLIRGLRDQGRSVTPFRLYPASGGLSYDSARTVIERNPTVVFATSVRFIAGRGHVQLPDSLASLIQATGTRKPVMLVSFGSPYLLNQLNDYSAGFLLAWSDTPAGERAVARALTGGAPISGHLPVTISPRFPRGYGIEVGVP